MLVGKIWGGLGNQLFQYAYLYAIKENSNVNLKLDTSFYGNQDLRSYRLDLLNIKYVDEIENNNLPITIQLLKRKWPNRFIRLIPIHRLKISNSWRYLKETKYKYLKFASQPKGHNIYIDGYWQTEKYFKKYKEEIKLQFKPKYTLRDDVHEMIDEVSSCCSVSVHIRRGDYLNISKLNTNLYLLNENYYRNAIKEINSKVQNPIFYFFSDDIEWVKNIYAESNFKYVSIDTETNDIDELMVMSNCKHHIVANSSYSWWGAWLNENEEQIVIAPERKYGNEDIVPENWLKIRF